MEPSAVASNEDREVLLADLLAEIHQLLRAGKPIDRKEYARRYPAYINELQALLPTPAQLAELRETKSADAP